MNDQQPFTLAELHREYVEQVLITRGITPGSIQYWEMSKAFYAGAMSLLLNLTKLADYSEEAGVKTLEALSLEGRNFFEAIAIADSLTPPDEMS